MGYVVRNLQSLRESAELSIPRLAALAHVGDFTIQRLEDNQLPRHVAVPPFTVNRRIVDQIADALGTDLETLGAVDVDVV